MRKLFNILIVLPLALIFLAFAVANRQFVTISFDPFSSTDPALGISLPLFIVLIAVAILGALAGGVAVWFGQGRWRRKARHDAREVRRLEAELADWRSSAAKSGAPVTGDGWKALRTDLPPGLPPAA